MTTKATTTDDLDAELLQLFDDYKAARHRNDKAQRERLYRDIIAMPAQTAGGIAVKMALCGDLVKPEAWKFLDRATNPALQSAFEDAQRLAGFDPERVNLLGEPPAVTLAN